MKINPNLVCELVGDDVLVLDSENATVMTLTGESSNVIKHVLAGEDVSITEPGVGELLARGVLVWEAPIGLSRRSVLMGGAAVGAGGILALGLPAAAYASSALPLDPPVFETIDSGTKIRDYDIGENAGGVEQLSFPSASVLSPSPLPEGYDFQWSFSPSSGFDYDFAFMADSEVGDRFVWETETPISIPSSNLEGTKVTVHIRLASGDRVSSSVAFVFDYD